MPVNNPSPKPTIQPAFGTATATLSLSVGAATQNVPVLFDTPYPAGVTDYVVTGIHVTGLSVALASLVKASEAPSPARSNTGLTVQIVKTGGLLISAAVTVTVDVERFA